MASVFANLKTYLKTIGAVTARIGTGNDAKIYQDEIKVNELRNGIERQVDPPFIRIEISPFESHEHLNGISGIGQAEAQIDCYDVTEALANALAEDVRVNLQGKNHFTLGAAYCNGVTASGVREGSDPPQRGAHGLRYWVSRDYLITYNEATS